MRNHEILLTNVWVAVKPLTFHAWSGRRRLDGVEYVGPIVSLRDTAKEAVVEYITSGLRLTKPATATRSFALLRERYFGNLISAVAAVRQGRDMSLRSAIAHLARFEREQDRIVRNHTAGIAADAGFDASMLERELTTLAVKFGMGGCHCGVPVNKDGTCPSCINAEHEYRADSTRDVRLVNS